MPDKTERDEAKAEREAEKANRDAQKEADKAAKRALHDELHPADDGEDTVVRGVETWQTSAYRPPTEDTAFPQEESSGGSQ